MALLALSSVAQARSERTIRPDDIATPHIAVSASSPHQQRATQHASLFDALARSEIDLESRAAASRHSEVIDLGRSGDEPPAAATAPSLKSARLSARRSESSFAMTAAHGEPAAVKLKLLRNYEDEDQAGQVVGSVLAPTRTL